VAVTLSSSRWTAARSALRNHPIPPLSLPLKRSDFSFSLCLRVSNFDRAPMAAAALPACLSLKLSWPNDKYQCLAGFVVFGYWCSPLSPHLYGRSDFHLIGIHLLGNYLYVSPTKNVLEESNTFLLPQFLHYIIVGVSWKVKEFQFLKAVMIFRTDIQRFLVKFKQISFFCY